MSKFRQLRPGDLAAHPDLLHRPEDCSYCRAIAEYGGAPPHVVRHGRFFDVLAFVAMLAFLGATLLVAVLVSRS